MATDDDISFDRSLLGVEHHIGTFHVTEEMIVDFSISTGETSPLFLDDAAAKKNGHEGIIAPPTFCNLFVTGVMRPDIKLEFGNTGLFAGQAIESLAPVRPGDSLDATTMLKEVYAKTGRSGKMVFAVWETGFTNQDGTRVALVRESFVRRNVPQSQPTEG